MSVRVIPKTFGEEFILQVENCETKGMMFMVLYNAVSQNYPQHNLSKYMQRISEFNSVATYQNKLARIRVAYNARAINEIQDKLINANNSGNENYKNKDKMVRKLNLLIHNNPTLDEIIYICMSAYIAKGLGTAKNFKIEIKKHLKSNIL